MLQGLRRAVKQGLRLLGRCRSLKGYQARMEVLARPEEPAVAGVEEWRLKVRNVGSKIWPSRGLHRVWLGYHWRPAEGGAYLSFDDGVRAPLPRPAAPGDEVVVTCSVRAPNTSGRYRLEFDLQRRFVGWFGDYGPAPLGVDCTVVGRRASQGAAEFDYHVFYQQFDLEKDYWTVVGPGTKEEFELLGRGKMRQLIELGMKPDSRLLDVGCGTGQLSGAVNDYLSSQGLYYGTDLAEEAVAFCRRRYRRPNFFFLANGMTTIPIDGIHFDFIYLGSVFTHMFPDEIQALLIELRRLLAPDGMIVGDLFLADDVATFAGSRGMVEINEAHLDGKLKATGLVYEPLLTWAHNDQVRRRILKFTLPASRKIDLAS
jgi:SAM-dependent methyltransferase